MKYFITLILCLTVLTNYGQEVKTEFNGHSWEAPYTLPVYKGWTIERFLIPISFAPSIPYNGVEDIRFTPGWGNAKTEEYWTYAFLWYLDNKPETDAKIIADNLKAYYTGLIRANSDSTQNSMPVITSFKKIETDKTDLETYSGTIEMSDYMQRKPIILNCMVHLMFCKEKNKTLIFYKLSPKPYTHPNWIKLNQLWTDFKCEK